MAYRGQGQKVQKVMVQPINLIFRYLQNRSRIQVWLYEQVNMRIEGCIIVGSCSKEIILLCSKAFPTSSGQAWERLRRGSGAAGDYIYSSCFTCTFSLG
ncbi:small nuclear ribonucleoprotein E isoform X1 [Rattus norvegicus]